MLSAGAAEGARVQLEIRDRGPGFHPAADRQDVGLASGSTPGLGLEIARAFTRASDGALTLRPLAGGGTVAALELPAAAAEGPPP